MEDKLLGKTLFETATNVSKNYVEGTDPVIDNAIQLIIREAKQVAAIGGFHLSLHHLAIHSSNYPGLSNEQICAKKELLVNILYEHYGLFSYIRNDSLYVQWDKEHTNQNQAEVG